MDTAAFDYDLPEASIAQEAIEPRDAARLLVAKGMEDRAFVDLPQILEPGDLVVVNNTRVRPARVHALKETGGRVELLLTKRISETEWESMVRPARRIRVGTRLTAGPLAMTVTTEPVRGVVTLDIESDESVDDVLQTLGEIPLPPYFHGALDDDERYQTMFATAIGSAAAPTAALHFTPALVEAIRERGVRFAEVDLEVGLDTFRPMDDGAITDHEMHRERYNVPQATADAIAETRQRGSRVVAVGTTVVRTLETAAQAGRNRPSRSRIHGTVHQPRLPAQRDRRGHHQLPRSPNHADRDDRDIDRAGVARGLRSRHRVRLPLPFVRRRHVHRG